MYLKRNSTKKKLLPLIQAVVILAIVVGGIWLWSFVRVYFSYSSYTKEHVLIKSSVLVGYIADTEAERTKGLSGKKYLPLNTAMLFKFDKPDTHGIWMKDMFFPIDIIWLDKNNEIVNLISNAEPSSYPHVFYPPEKALYVLEVRSGLIKDKGLKLGDEILLEKNNS